MDVDMARWILEYLLRQPPDAAGEDDFLRELPIPNDNVEFKKLLLLRTINSEISNGTVSEKILEYLELIEELDFLSGIDPSNSIRAAYCAVAVDCAVKCLNDAEGSKWKYFDVVKRLWRGRICKIDDAGSVGLLSEELRSWKDDIEAAVWEETACGDLLVRCRGNDAVGAVRVFVEEAYERIGPSFLELAVQNLVNDDDAVSTVSNRRICGYSPRGGAEASALLSVYLFDAGNCMFQGVSSRLHRGKHVSVGHRITRGAKVTDAGDIRAEPCRKYDLPSTPEVDSIREALRSSAMELQALVKDPLPEALDFADSVILSKQRENLDHVPRENPSGAAKVVEENVVQNKDVNHDTIQENQDMDDKIVEENAGISIQKEKLDHEPTQEKQNVAEIIDVEIAGIQTEREYLDNKCSSHQHAPKPSLLKRNSSAHADEWDESVEEELQGHGRSIHLPSPKERVVSPLKKYEPKNVSKRRKIKRWSNSEEDTLRMGVNRFGAGSWKLILSTYKDNFPERTEVDLKDKWRNMMRAG